jgi:hypothetical protein
MHSPTIGFPSNDNLIDDTFHLFIDRAIGTIESPSGEILRCPETSGDDEGVQVCGSHFGQVTDVTTGNARGLCEHIALLWHLISGDVIHHMVLFGIGRHANGLASQLVDRQQREDTLVDLRTVIHATS